MKQEIYKHPNDSPRPSTTIKCILLPFHPNMTYISYYYVQNHVPKISLVTIIAVNSQQWLRRDLHSIIPSCLYTRNHHPKPSPDTRYFQTPTHSRHHFPFEAIENICICKKQSHYVTPKPPALCLPSDPSPVAKMAGSKKRGEIKQRKPPKGLLLLFHSTSNRLTLTARRRPNLLFILRLSQTSHNQFLKPKTS